MSNGLSYNIMSHVVSQPAAPDTARRKRVAFESVAEDAPGPVWQGMFERDWPGWSRWLRRAQTDEGVDARAAERALRRHMPEFAGVWERLVGLAGGGDEAARFLTFWSPPRYLASCSQAVILDDDGPALVRNYDFDPAMIEGYLFKSAWLGSGSIGMVEGIAGVADGMNRAGLALSLAFGGRPVIGRGFGIPLILRYLLELCSDVQDAVEGLRALPCHMSYNVTLLDRHGRHATVLLSPDRPAIVTPARHATNHQLGVEWPRHARISRTVERERLIGEALGEHRLDAPRLRDLFLAPPIHSRGYGDGFGTVYTALYRPAAGTVELSWPGIAPMRKAFADFTGERREITFVHDSPPSLNAGPSDPHRTLDGGVAGAAEREWRGGDVTSN